MSDEEIEYLDEDEELVQKCVEALQDPEKNPVTTEKTNFPSPSPLLVERQKSKRGGAVKKRGKKTKIENSDSDYNPNQDEGSDYDLRSKKKYKKPTKKQKQVQKPEKAVVLSQAKKKFKDELSKYPNIKFGSSKKITGAKKVDANVQTAVKKSKALQVTNTLKKSEFNLMLNKKAPVKKPTFMNKQGFKHNSKKILAQTLMQKEYIMYKVRRDPMRKLHDIKLCDRSDSRYFQDIQLKNNDVDVIKKWNNTCIKLEDKLRAENSNSNRTAQYLRKVRSKVRGSKDNYIRIHCEMRIDAKLSNMEALMPRFDYTNPLEVKFDPNEFHCTKDTFENKSEALINKEGNKEGEVLVIYNVKQFQVSTYEIVNSGNEDEPTLSNEIRLLMTCAMCAKCYQYSWRGCKEPKGEVFIKCVICSSLFTSAYNLLAHLRSHKLSDLEKWRQNRMLAKLMPYHYNCRICKFVAESIPDLRNHIRTDHRRNERFYCEVGRHITM